MGFPTAALSAGQLTSIRRNAHKSIQYISLLPNTVIQTTTLASTVGTSGNYASLTLAATVDADVEVGHTVILTPSATLVPGMTIAAVMRVRSTPSGTSLPINESDLIIGSGTYVHIIDDYRIQPKLARIDSSGNYFKDYNLTYAKPRPLVNGIQSAYAGFIDSGTSVLTISFTPTGQPITSGATITTWAWDVADGTITVGTASTQNITVTFPEGFRWVTVVITDSEGRTGWRRIPIWAHGDTFTPATGFNGATINGSWEAGYSANTSAFDGIDDYIDETLCVIWRREWYGDTEENIVNNIDFVGRLRNETTRARGDADNGTLVEDNEFNIEGPGQQLQRIAGPVISIWDNATATPTQWDYIYINTPARAIVHILKEHSTFCELHSLEWSSDFGDAARWLVFGTNAGDMLSTVNDIAQSIQNGGLEFAPDGASRLVSDYRVSQLTGEVTWVSLDEGDTLAVNLEYDHVAKFAKIEASGGTYNASSRTITPFIVTVPSALGTSGYEIGRLDRQIIAAGAGNVGQLKIYAQYWFSALNRRFQLSAELPDGLHFFIPSRRIRYRIDLGPDTNARGYEILYGGWLCTSISIRQDNIAGTRDVSAEFAPVGINTAAAAEPDEPEFADEQISVPVSDIQQDGNTVVVWADDGVWITTNFKQTNDPLWHDITPTLGANETIKQCAWSYSNPRLYMLTYDSSSTESRVWYKTNGHDLYEAWKAGAAVTGEYTILRATHEDAHLYIYAPVVSGNAVTRFSDDSGQTLSSAQTVGANASATGFDTIRIGTVTLAGYTGNVGISTTEAGTYSSYTAQGPLFLFIPRYKFGGTTSNINTSTPDYLTHTSKVTNSGATVTALFSPSGNYAAGVNAVVMPWISGSKIVGLFSNNGLNNTDLLTSIDAGANWTTVTISVSGLKTGMSDGYVRMRRTDPNANEIYMTWAKLNVSTQIYYSPDFGTSNVLKTMPDEADAINGIEVYG